MEVKVRILPTEYNCPFIFVILCKCFQIWDISVTYSEVFRDSSVNAQHEVGFKYENCLQYLSVCWQFLKRFLSIYFSKVWCEKTHMMFPWCWWWSNKILALPLYTFFLQGHSQAVYFLLIVLTVLNYIVWTCVGTMKTAHSLYMSPPPPQRFSNKKCNVWCLRRVSYLLPLTNEWTSFAVNIYQWNRRNH